MKYLFIILLCMAQSKLICAAPIDTVWLQQTSDAFFEIWTDYTDAWVPLHDQLVTLDDSLQSIDPVTSSRACLFLLEKSKTEAEMQKLISETELQVLRLRYRKSVEIIKMLYEKILSIDHHFSGLKAHQLIAKISNPHEYAEFKEIKTVLDERMKKKFGFGMPSIMESNPILAAVFSVVGLAVTNGDDKLKKDQLESINCILDFTVRMHQDLSLISFETGYLREANLTLKQTCETLFSDCGRQVGYTIPLQACREGDDWERLFALLDNYIVKSNAATEDPIQMKKATANLQFSVDRVVHFIEKYADFVNQGNEYYKKFEKIASNYANEQACSKTLPDQFQQLKLDIQSTLEKFNTAYSMPEIQGSRLKDLLYGIPEK